MQTRIFWPKELACRPELGRADPKIQLQINKRACTLIRAQRVQNLKTQPDFSKNSALIFQKLRFPATPETKFPLSGAKSTPQKKPVNDEENLQILVIFPEWIDEGFGDFEPTHEEEKLQNGEKWNVEKLSRRQIVSRFCTSVQPKTSYKGYTVSMII